MHACRDFVCMGKGRRSVGIPNVISSLPVELVEGSPLGIAQQMAARRFTCIPAACHLLLQVRFPRDVTLLCLVLLHAVQGMQSTMAYGLRGVELVRLPAKSPGLNLVEKMWG